MKWFRFSQGTCRWDRWLGLALAGAYFTMLASTLDIGFSRDESFYFHAAEQYSRWYDVLVDNPAKAFTKEAVSEHFAYNPEHPALPKMLYALSWRLFGKMHDPVKEPWSRNFYDRNSPPKTILGWLSESTAMRLPALLVNSTLIYFLFMFGVRFFNRRVALAGTVAYILMPHAFWHSHIACFDMPITALWFITGYCFLRAEQSGWKWALLTGLAWGLALSVKHNAYFIPPTLFFWWLATRWREFGISRNGGLHLRIPPIPVSWLAMLIVAPVVYYLLWPKLWFDPLGHLKYYIGRHAGHEYYWAYYFGTLYTQPPFPMDFPFAMSAMTIPTPTVLLALVGFGRLLFEWIVRRCAVFSAALKSLLARLPQRMPGVVAFVFINFLIPFAIIAHPKTPIFGGTKHWMPGIPYLALIAGLGFELVWQAIAKLGVWQPRLGHRWLQIGLAALAALAFVAPGVLATFHGHTNGTTYFNALSGGYGAMGRYGMEREFWGNTAFSALDFINRRAMPNARVDFHDTTYEAVQMYWRDGLLRRDIRPVWNMNAADFHLFHWHKEFLDLEADIKENFGVTVPAYVAAQDGVPLLNAYQRPPRQAPVGTKRPR